MGKKGGAKSPPFLKPSQNDGWIAKEVVAFRHCVSIVSIVYNGA